LASEHRMSFCSLEETQAPAMGSLMMSDYVRRYTKQPWSCV